MKRTMYLALALGVAVVAALAVGFGLLRSSDTDSHNAQDVTFAQLMIPHHQQAVAMAKLADSRATNPAVKRLAVAIEKGQEPEIKQMTGWLQSWNQPTSVPMANMPGMSGHDIGATMPGMMSDADLATLATLTGAAFDKAFLTMMIAHHQGAIDMAKAERATGKSTVAKKLADAISTAQAKEIATMAGLLHAG